MKGNMPTTFDESLIFLHTIRNRTAPKKVAAVDFYCCGRAFLISGD
jgi:hypothetical protein